MTPQLSHPYGTQSKTKVNSNSLLSSYEDEECTGVISNLFNLLQLNYGGKQAGYLQFHPYCMQKLKSFVVMLIPTCTITVRVICGHGVLRLSI